MLDDTLKALLRQADTRFELPLRPAAEIVRDVEQTVRRRHRRAATFTLALPLLLAIGGAVIWGALRLGSSISIDDRLLTAKVPQQTPGNLDDSVDAFSTETAQVLAEIAALNTQAEFHLQVAEELIKSRQRDAAQMLQHQALSAGEPAEEVRQRLDFVAYRMINRADRLRNEPSPEEDPARIYREVVRLFPTLGSADVARWRLTEFEAKHPPGGA